MSRKVVSESGFANYRGHAVICEHMARVPLKRVEDCWRVPCPRKTLQNTSPTVDDSRAFYLNHFFFLFFFDQIENGILANFKVF